MALILLGIFFWREGSEAALGPDRSGGGRKGVDHLFGWDESVPCPSLGLGVRIASMFPQEGDDLGTCFLDLRDIHFDLQET